jgi:hypothetical protein
LSSPSRLPSDRHDALNQSVVAHGVETATTWDDEGNLLDGWERETICIDGHGDPFAGFVAGNAAGVWKTATSWSTPRRSSSRRPSLWAKATADRL